MNIYNLRKEVVNAKKIVDKYLSIKREGFGGGMHPKAAQLWAYLLAIQNSFGISGDLVEIGVYNGWGSYLPACYCQTTEKVVLVDIAKYHLEQSKKFLINETSINESNIEMIGIDSTRGEDLLSLFRKRERFFRWAHIDGEHSYAAVIKDLNSVATFALPEAIICVDDVDHPMAPCVNEAMHNWLEQNREWQLLIRGYNKAYLISTRSKIPWLQYINFLPEIFKRFFLSDIMLASQTHSSDTKYFSYGDPIVKNKWYLKVNQTLSQIEDFEGPNPRVFLLGENRKPTILVFGNCQMRILYGALVMATHLCGIDIRFEYIADVHELNDQDAEQIKNVAQKADGIICQIVTGDKFKVKTNELLALLKNNLIITLPSMHFNAYWPNHADLQMIPGSPHCMPVDVLIYIGVQNGLTVEEIRNLLLSPDLFQPNDLEVWSNEAIQRLRQREEINKLTIQISDFLEKEARKERLFYTFNHPKKKLFDHVLKKLLKELRNYFEPRQSATFAGIIEGNIEIQYDMSMIDFIDFPLLISVANFFGFSKTDTVNRIYRYIRPRGSREIHQIVTIDDEIQHVKRQFSLISEEQKKFNDDVISSWKARFKFKF